MSNPKGKKSFRAWLDPSTMDMINNNYKKAIFSNLKGIVDLAASQINRMEFRNCVELAMIESILAVTHDIDRDDLEKLRGDCVQIVKRTTGNFNFEKVLDWHRGKDT